MAKCTVNNNMESLLMERKEEKNIENKNEKKVKQNFESFYSFRRNRHHVNVSYGYLLFHFCASNNAQSLHTHT